MLLTIKEKNNFLAMKYENVKNAKITKCNEIWHKYTTKLGAAFELKINEKLALIAKILMLEKWAETKSSNLQ